MSSILDALDRAEQERRRHRVVSMGEPLGPSRPGWNRQGFWLLAGALLLGNLIVWLLVWRSDNPDDAATARQTVQTAPAPRRNTTMAAPVAFTDPAQSHSAAANQSSPGIEEQLKRGLRPGARPLIEEAQVKKPALRAQPIFSALTPQPPQQADPQVNKAPEEPGISVAAAMRQQMLKPIEAEPSMPASLATGLEDPADAKQPAEPAAANAPALSAWEATPSIWEVPDGVRAKVEGLKTSVHVYNREPAKRFVIINRRRYREGDNLGDASLKLKQITREGIVIDYGDGEVRM